MAKFSNKENRITIRLTNVMHSQLTTYAKAYNMTLTKAVEQLLDEGLKAKNNQLVTKSDIELVLSETMRIKEQQQRLSEQNETTRVALVQAIQNQPIAAMQPPKHKILRFLN